jgi:hypothetical protein
VPDQIVEAMERSLWGPYEAGHNPAVAYMAHLREPVRALPKPLAWYALAEGLAGVKHAALAAAGFRCERLGAFAYYTYALPPAAGAGAGSASAAGSGRPGTEPIFFAHGVGLGLLPYLGFVLKLAALGRPVIAIEYPHLAMRWTPHIPTVDEASWGASARASGGGPQGQRLGAPGVLFRCCRLGGRPRARGSLAAAAGLAAAKPSLAALPRPPTHNPNKPALPSPNQNKPALPPPNPYKPALLPPNPIERRAGRRGDAGHPGPPRHPPRRTRGALVRHLLPQPPEPPRAATGGGDDADRPRVHGGRPRGGAGARRRRAPAPLPASRCPLYRAASNAPPPTAQRH